MAPKPVRCHNLTVLNTCLRHSRKDARKELNRTSRAATRDLAVEERSWWLGDGDTVQCC
jgi:hypothetical protein